MEGIFGEAAVLKNATSAGCSSSSSRSRMSSHARTEPGEVDLAATTGLVALDIALAKKRVFDYLHLLNESALDLDGLVRPKDKYSSDRIIKKPAQLHSAEQARQCLRYAPDAESLH